MCPRHLRGFHAGWLSSPRVLTQCFHSFSPSMPYPSALPRFFFQSGSATMVIDAGPAAAGPACLNHHAIWLPQISRSECDADLWSWSPAGAGPACLDHFVS